jgi:outer membrane lipoprotein-sorting protein
MSRLAVGALVVALTVALAGRAGATADPAAVATLEAMEPAYAAVTGYVARFIRQEVIDGRLRPREEALLKFQRPNRVYLRWVGGPPKGREMLYPAPGGDTAVVYEPGLVTGMFTVVLAPDSPHVLKESRHPLTDVGIGRLVDLVLANARRGLSAGDADILDRGVGDEGGRTERRIEMVFPRRAERPYYARRALIGVDTDMRLPVRATIFDWDERLVEHYEYRDVRLNPALSSRDFEASNPDYGFPRWRITR